ncbi:MAG: tetratricopeptide repeat protein [Acidobacteriaceae bacterium]|nr:tetratricopeptide repeat protein [Acidobacteriaceae bacterium]
MPAISLLLFTASLAFAASLPSSTDGVSDFKAGRYSEAAAELARASDPTSRAFFALSKAALGDCKTALPGLTAPYSDPTLARLTSLAAVKCDPAHSFDRIARLEQLFPNDPDVLYTAAKLHMKAFNDATFAMFQRAPASYRVHELSAEIFEVEARYSDAVAEYTKAIELNPAAPDLHYRLGRALLLESHDPAVLVQAAAEFRSELKLSPEDAACEFQLGQIAQVQSNSAEAKSHFERALALSPDFVQALISLGKLSSQQKDYPRAIALLSRATSLQPSNETAHYALLTAYRDSGDMPRANAEKATLDKLQKPPQGEFSEFLKKLGEKPPEQ